MATCASTFDFLLCAQIGLVSSQAQGKKVTFRTATTWPRLTNGFHKSTCGLPGNLFWYVADVKSCFLCTWPQHPLPEHVLSSAGCSHCAPPCPSSLGLQPRQQASPAHGQLRNSGPGASPGNALNGHGSAAAVTANIAEHQERVRRVIPIAGHWLGNDLFSAA